METQNNLIDYNSESKRIAEFKTNSQDYWNAKEGKFEVVALSELTRFQITEKDGTVKEKAKLSIEVDKKPLIWTMGIGQTKASLYGQLVDLAISKGGKLVGNKFTVVIKFDGTKRDFTIV